MTGRTTVTRRIAIACGGTAGHIYPALALADAYRQSYPQTELLFIGTPAGLERNLVPVRGYSLELVPGEPLAREPIAGKLHAVGSLAAGVVAARRLLKDRDMKLVIGFGGYATAGTLIAARSLGVKIALHEANVKPGLTNRLLVRLADRIYVAFDRTASEFSESRTLFAGNPIRREILNAAANRRQRRVSARARFFITGGSGGSNFLNREVPALLHSLASHGLTAEVLHQAGAFPLAPIRTAYERFGIAATVTEYIKDIGDAYGWADFVIACAGSQTLSEIAACALPCLIVPLSVAAAGHQAANAIALAEAGRNLWTREEDWDTAALAEGIAALLKEDRVADDFPARENADAAAIIIADLERVMKDRWEDVSRSRRS